MTVHALILAGGEGQRLRLDGVATPKAFVELGGQTLVGRLIQTFRRFGCGSITVAFRQSVLDRMGRAASRSIPEDVQVVPGETPSSLHTLTAGLKAVPPGPLVCTMVDTVMREEDWERLFARGDTLLRAGADACVAVTSYVDDERPLYVARSGDGAVRSFGENPVAPPLVTGGVYFLSTRARDLAPRVLRLGVHRMRGFLGWLVDHGYRVETADVERIIDLDRASDISVADAWLAGSTPAPRSDS